MLFMSKKLQAQNLESIITEEPLYSNGNLQIFSAPTSGLVPGSGFNVPPPSGLTVGGFNVPAVAGLTVGGFSVPASGLTVGGLNIPASGLIPVMYQGQPYYMLNDLIIENDNDISEDMISEDMINEDSMNSDDNENKDDNEVDDLPIRTLSRFSLKDYGFQSGNNLHCCFKYIAIVYDQMCDCIDGYGREDRLLTCEGDFDNLGLLTLGHESFNRLLDDINFQFDSEIGMEFSLIAKELKNYLVSWCKKITRVSLNTEYIYQTKLDLYDSEMITEIMSNIRLHNPKYTKEELERLKYSVLDIEVVFDDLQYYKLHDIGLNLTYCNFLIYKFLEKTYNTCGFYLSCHKINKDNVPFYQGPPVKSAYCHLYLVPLNLTKFYYDYGKQ